MFRSLRLRLAVVNALILILLLVGLGLIGLQAYRTSVDRNATEELLAVVDEYTGIIAAEGPTTILDHHSDPSDAAILVAIFAADGTRVGGTSDPPPWLVRKDAEITDGSVDGDPVRFATGDVRFPDGASGTLVVARSLQRQGEAVEQLWRTYLSGLIEVVILSALFGWWISGRMIRPVIRSYEAQRDFAADASHELRTPLTFIRAGVETLAPSRPELGAQVLEEIDYMTALTERMLLLARAESGTLRVEPRPFDLGRICRASADRGRTAHALRIEVEGADLTAAGDPVLTETILDALLENVARHADGAATISYRRDGASARVEVIDRGEGIPGDALGTVFTRFGRLEPSRDRASGGAGLGLPLARELARAQGGDLVLSPTPGGGLTAKLVLQVAEAA